MNQMKCFTVCKIQLKEDTKTKKYIHNVRCLIGNVKIICLYKREKLYKNIENIKIRKMRILKGQSRKLPMTFSKLNKYASLKYGRCVVVENFEYS